MKCIRRQVFETNSSSMHSISIVQGDVLEFPNSITMTFGEFGWEEESYNDAQTKLTYVLTAIQYYADRPEYPSKPDEVSWKDWETGETMKQYNKDYEHAVLNNKFFRWIKELLEECGVKVFEYLRGPDTYWRFGYIDHQSSDTLDEIWSDDEDTFKANMKNFIFNPFCVLTTDNDNH